MSPYFSNRSAFGEPRATLIGSSIVSCLTGLLIAAAGVVPIAGSAQGHPCGPLTSSYGPFDYRTSKEKLEVVHRVHFNDGVESLIKGMTGSLEGDLTYVLHVSPNHHRALISLMRLAERPTFRPERMRWKSVDCYFDRAVRFAPDDSTVRMIFAMHLSRTQRIESAVSQLKHAEEIAQHGLTYFNIGLLYFELGLYEEALRLAHRAMASGLARSELRDKLQAAGKWANPDPSETDNVKRQEAAQDGG